MTKTYDLLFEKDELFSDYYLNDEETPMTCLPTFNTINIIIGANNSGKSRFRRKLMEQASLKLPYQDIFYNYNLEVDNINKILKSRGINIASRLINIRKDEKIEEILRDNLSNLQYFDNSTYELQKRQKIKDFGRG